MANKFISCAYEVLLTHGQLRWTCGFICECVYICATTSKIHNMAIRSRIFAIQVSTDSYGRVLFSKNSFMIFWTRQLAVKIIISYIVFYTILKANKFVSFAYEVLLTRGQSR